MMNSINKDLECPIGYCLMTDPVTDILGHTYQREYIEKWYSNNNISPIAHTIMSNKNLIPNLLIKRQVQEYLENNKLQIDSNENSEMKSIKPDINYSINKVGDNYNVRLNDKSTNNTPIHLVLLVDESGSMATNCTIKNQNGEEEDYGISRLDLVRQSILSLIHCLLNENNTFYITIICFNSYAEIHIDKMLINQQNLLFLENKLNLLRTKGATNIWDAFRLAFNTIKKDETINSKIVLFTDGHS